MQLSINNRRTFLNFINDPTFYIFGDIFLATRVLKLNSVYTSFLKRVLNRCSIQVFYAVTSLYVLILIYLFSILFAKLNYGGFFNCIFIFYDSGEITKF